MFRRICYLVRKIKKEDPAAKNWLQILLFYPGVHAVFFHRISHWLYCHRLGFLADCMALFSRFLTHIEIHPGAEIGLGLFIDHGSGVVIGETAVIGNDCVIYHGVTLGSSGKKVEKAIRRHPVLKDGVIVGCGAKILGSIVVGEFSKVAAGAVVLKNVPKNSTVVGVPAKIVKTNANLN